MNDKYKDCCKLVRRSQIPYWWFDLDLWNKKKGIKPIALSHLPYRAFHRFGQAKFANGGSILGSSQFTLLPQLPLRMMLSLKVVRIDSKINKSLRYSKSVTHSVCMALFFAILLKSLACLLQAR